MSDQTLTFEPIDLQMTRVYVLRGTRPILIDAGKPGDEGIILAGLKRLGIAPQELGLILLSHGHYDHFGSAAALQKATGAALAIGLPDGPLARLTRTAELLPTSRLAKLAISIMGNTAADNLRPATPTWYIGGRLDLRPYGVAGQVLPTPGHTAGSLSVALENGDIFIADLLMGLPFPKRPGRPIFLEDEAAWRASLRQVLALHPRRLLASHGGPFTPERVIRRFPWAAP